MINIIQDRTYRKDIDGLRALAVLAVIVFHFGYLPNGFLGVDIFFVISGFLITGIINKEIKDNHFSIINFYLRRIRRIIPLALFVGLVALITGIFTMLPDDMENLAQSLIATNFFANNILQAITTKNYWDVVNEYKPLMHTWSLGVEEQFYLLYPLLFMFTGRKKGAWLLPIICTLAAGSLILYLLPFQSFQKFYLIFFRFWELAAGGIAVIILKNRLFVHKYSVLLVLFLIFLLCFEFSFLAPELILLLTVLLTLGILISSNENSLLENKALVLIGKISFSLYMWHQVLIAYARYLWVQELHAEHLIIIFVLTFTFSLISYYLIEQPFRNKNLVQTRDLLLIVGLVFLVTTSGALYIYQSAGVLKDIPELGIRKSDTERNIHAKYNARIYDYDNNFKLANKIKVLVIGNSFARDWVNVLLESKYSDALEISYIYDPYQHKELKTRIEEADIIFYSTPHLRQVQDLELPQEKLWAIGTKNFGTSNGIFYNYKGENYYEQRTLMEGGVLEQNKIMQQEWGNRYINYIEKLIDDNNTVPVFTPAHKFISQDCRHFTQAGAQYYAKLFEPELEFVFLQVGWSDL